MTASVEVAAIREFLAGCPPFDELPAEVLGHAASKVQIAYYRAGDPGAILDDPSQRLYSMPLLAVVVDTLLLENQRLQRNSTGQHEQGLRLSDCRRRYKPTRFSCP